ncbi:MAG: tRNA-dihydrouridine synthase B [Phycisphaerales bacterium]|jgi:tRNA-dihydrouridine synthase B
MIGLPLTLRAPDGPVALESNLMLAPIAGWCDLAWRLTCRSFGGVGLACTDLLSPHGLLADSEASRDLARTNDLDKPIGMQLYGADPAMLADAAGWCAAHGATVVDINMGCPVDKVCKKDGGSGLMRDLDKAFAIFEAVRAALPNHIPLTGKMRLGWDEADYQRGVAGTLACGLADRGAALITVHGRTTEMKFKGDCRQEGIKRVVEDVAAHTGAYDGTTTGGIPVIGNGDLKSPGDVVAMIRGTGCAGVMIGRASFACPWLFNTSWELQRAIAQNRETEFDPASVEPSEDEKLDGVRDYFTRMLEFRDERYALSKVRQKISWLGKGINGSHCRALKDGVRTSKNGSEVLAAIEAWRNGAQTETPPLNLRP